MKTRLSVCLLSALCLVALAAVAIGASRETIKCADQVRPGQLLQVTVRAPEGDFDTAVLFKILRKTSSKTMARLTKLDDGSTLAVYVIEHTHGFIIGDSEVLLPEGQPATNHYVPKYDAVVVSRGQVATIFVQTPLFTEKGEDSIVGVMIDLGRVKRTSDGQDVDFEIMGTGKEVRFSEPLPTYQDLVMQAKQASQQF